MPDARPSSTRRLTVSQTSDNLVAPFPRPQDRVEIRHDRQRSFSVFIRNPEGEDLAVLEGRPGNDRRSMVGTYGIYGEFTMVREPGEKGLRLRCEVRRSDDETDAGCWVADEDDT